jgi:hypothetical protein
VRGANYITVVPLIISLLVAAASTYFSTHALLEQRKSREASTDPVLVVHLGQRIDARELVTLNLSNVGAGAALNVFFEVLEPDEPAEQKEKRRIIQRVFKAHHPFSVVLQGQTIEFDFAMGWYLLGQGSKDTVNPEYPLKPLPPFQAKVTYEDLAGGQYASEFTIDVRELEGRGASKSPQMRIVSALEEIAKKLN